MGGPSKEKIMKLSIYSIVKNEEAEIEAMIESAKGADEHVIVDTGSTDRTIELIKKYPHVKLYTDYTWNDNFAEAKNHAASKCTGDWLCSLDADCRLDPIFLEQAKKMIETTKHDALFVNLSSLQFKGYNHNRAKIYRNNANIFYKGMAHEDLNIFGKIHESGIVPKIWYGFSINHKKDPDRYIRIMAKQLDADPTNPRYHFYLAQSHFDRKNYVAAIAIFRDYLTISKYLKERVEALIYITRAHWALGQGGKAREACNQAILSNPDHKSALTWMAKIHDEPWKHKWQKIADNASNEDAMFVR